MPKRVSELTALQLKNLKTASTMLEESKVFTLRRQIHRADFF